MLGDDVLSGAAPVSAASVAIVGGGPAGLMAAEALLAGGRRVDIFDAMPSLGRKFLLAGKGGMNITHSEPADAFLARYGARAEQVRPWLAAFGPDALRTWIHELGIETFVGSSGRVFPLGMKAAPLLRAWLHRLRAAGAGFHVRHRWLGWDRGENADGGSTTLRFATPSGVRSLRFDAVVLALGGGSWARLGSDGAWVPWLQDRGVGVAALRPANCGFDVAARDSGAATGWSAHFRERFAGEPVKTVALTFTDGAGRTTQRRGEFVISASGLEGGAVYALSAALRDEIERAGSATLALDLAPDKPLQRVIDEVEHPRGSRSLASHLQSRAGITGVKAGLLRELLAAEALADPQRLAKAIKSLPLRLAAPRPLDEAISSAGGVVFDEVDERLMLRRLPGVFCAGEMLDWEAPTGGYLLTACFASGRTAGAGTLAWLNSRGTAA